MVDLTTRWSFWGRDHLGRSLSVSEIFPLGLLNFHGWNWGRLGGGYCAKKTIRGSVFNIQIYTLNPCFQKVLHSPLCLVSWWQSLPFNIVRKEIHMPGWAGRAIHWLYEVRERSLGIWIFLKQPFNKLLFSSTISHLRCTWAFPWFIFPLADLELQFLYSAKSARFH